MANYNSARFSPPAPLANVVLQNPQNGSEEKEVPMLLDTGSDVTLTPQSDERRLNLFVSR